METSPYRSEQAVRELLHEKYSTDKDIVDNWLETPCSLLGNLSAYGFVKKYTKIHAELGVSDGDAWQEIAGIIRKCYG